MTDTDLWETTAATGAGYGGSLALRLIAEEPMPWDIPNEAYGIAVAGLGFAYSPAYNREIAVGGSLYTLDALAQRFGLKSEVTEVLG